MDFKQFSLDIENEMLNVNEILYSDVAKMKYDLDVEKFKND